MIVQLERNPRGPRLYVLGVRIHECHLGLALLAVDLAGWAADLWSLSVWSGGVALVGGWMVVKDWRDLVPSLRDTGAWSVGVHGRFAPLRALRYADGLPTLAGAVTFAIGVVNLVSALTPNIAWRHHLLLQLEPVRAVPLFHTLAIPASVALIVTSFHLRARRRRAWQVSLVLLVALGVLDLVKGLDVEEAALSWAGAALLWWGRESFVVRHARLRWRSLLSLVAMTFLVCAVLVAGAVWLSSGRSASPMQVTRDVIDLFAWTRGSVVFHDELSWVPLAVGAFGLALIVVGGHVFFRPLPPPRRLPDSASREAAYDLVRAHGSDTLAFFKLRRDLHYLFSPDRQAFLGYRVEGRVLLVAGDPIGPTGALPALVRETCAFAEVRGLETGGLGREFLAPASVAAGRPQRALHRRRGDPRNGGASRSKDERSARCASRSTGWRRPATPPAPSSPRPSRQRHSRSSSGSRTSGVPATAERGFSMAMDSLAGEHQAESVVILARDETGAVRGFLHFVPSFGRPAMSLSFMRRERNTPNGLTEFLVVKAVELLRERGIEEISLNFAAFGRLLERPNGRFERRLGRLVALGNRYFQTESLYRFNAKFSPRWEPRYLVYESVLGLPRVGLAAITAEGQRPRRRSQTRAKERGGA